MAQLQSPEMITLRRYLSILVVLCIGGILSVSAYTAIRQAEMQNIEFEFIDAAKEQLNEIVQAITHHQHAIETLTAFYQVNPNPIAPAAFQTFAQPLLEQQQGLHALYWVALPSIGLYPERAPPIPITQVIHKPHVAGFAADFNLNAVVNFADLTRQLPQHGYWVSQVMPMMTHSAVMGVHLLYPVYAPATPNQPKHLRGVIGGLVELDALLADSAARISHSGINIFIYDNSTMPFQLIGTNYANAAAATAFAQLDGDDNLLRVNKTISLANRTWLINCQTTPTYLAINTTSLPMLILIGGLVFMGLILAYLLMFISRTGALQREMAHRQRLMEELQCKERELAAFANCAPVMLWMTDEVGQCVLLNETWLNFTGHVRPEEFAQKWTDSIHPDDLDHCSEVYIETFFNQHQDFHMVYRVLRHDGAYRWVSETGIARYDESNEFLGYVGACVDITEQKKAEEAVYESQRQLATLMSNLPGMAYRCHYQNGPAMAFVSHGCRELTGYKPLEFTKQSIHLLDIVHPEDKLQLEAVLEEALHKQQAYQTSYRIFTANGIEKWVWEQGQFSLNISTQMSMLEGFITDISEQKRAEVAMDHARQLAEDANRSKSQFLANMSHELRTPLNAILGYSEILQEEAEDAGFNEFLPDLGKIRSAGQHLLSLINDILDISKIEAGKMDVYAETFDLHQVLLELADTVQPALQKRGNVLRLQISELVAEVHTDVVKTRQILLNLLSNAAKFTENGIITLRAEHTATPQGDYVTISVKDTGIGISAAQQDKLFQAFTQADASTTRKYGGTGLGLAISYQFAHMLQGTLVVESEADKGSTFTVQLPTQLNQDAMPVTVVNAKHGGNAEKTATTEQTVNRVPASSHEVLVVEDDITTRDMVMKVLNKAGCEVTGVQNGTQALAVLAMQTPDLILLDLMMPEMDGFEFVYELRNHTEWAEIPIVVLTAKDIDHADRQQLNGCVQKIFRKGEYGKEQLLAEVHKLLAVAPVSETTASL